MGVRVVFPDMGKDPSVQLIEKTITENGTYDAITDGANGYSKVNVNVEGGGGSSDFSTAEVTFKPILGSNYQVVVPYFDDPSGLSLMVEVYSEDEPFTLQIPIYKDGNTILLTNVDLPVTGNIEAAGKIMMFGLLLHNYYITGDCTIGSNQ